MDVVCECFVRSRADKHVQHKRQGGGTSIHATHFAIEDRKIELMSTDFLLYSAI